MTLFQMNDNPAKGKMIAAEMEEASRDAEMARQLTLGVKHAAECPAGLGIRLGQMDEVGLIARHGVEPPTSPVPASCPKGR
jgi:hypothetical protein